MRRKLAKCALAIGGIFLALSCASTPQDSVKLDRPPLHLVIGLDGVSYTVVKKMHDGGYFRDFHPPMPMVATFPSLSDSNWTRLMQSPLMESYTKSYFNMHEQTTDGQGTPSGSLINHLTQNPPYEHYFDFKPEGIFQHIAIVTWTETTALYWLESLEKQFFATRNRDYFYAFIMNTDIIAHTQGEAALFKYLSILDKRLKNLREEVKQQYGYDLQITIVSDHGNYFIKPQPVSFEQVLAQKGWSIKSSLKDKNDVGVVIPEIISFASFQCLKGSERRLALDLSETEGIDVTVYLSSENEIHVVSRGGQNESLIFVDPKKQTVDYRVIKGQDPLQQDIYFRMKPMDWKEYFLKSYESEYPYAAVRIWEGFYKNSKQSGVVLASPELGRVFANSTLKMLTAIKGLTSTHGSLHKIETWGTLISTKDSFYPIRPDDFSSVVSLKEYKEKIHH